MDGPDQRDREGRPSPAEAAAQKGAGQRAGQHAPEGEGGQDVDEDVERVIAADVQAVERVVDGQGQAHEGPAPGGSELRRGRHGLPRRPERLDVRVLGDAGEVVENEGDGQAARVDGGIDRHEDDHGERRAPA
jgi:hypothetical protein